MTRDELKRELVQIVDQMWDYEDPDYECDVAGFVYWVIAQGVVHITKGSC
jgi:hypothetical protein